MKDLWDEGDGKCKFEQMKQSIFACTILCDVLMSLFQDD